MPDDKNIALKSNDQKSAWRAVELQYRPGFLIRRLHQIHVSLFMEECADEGITPIQYSVLTALEQIGPTEQIVLARAVGLDRTNTADVISRLEQRKLVRRRAGSKDKRVKITTLTDVGKALLARVEASAERAHERTLAPLSPEARAEFLKSMAIVVEANNDISRSPVGSI